MNQNPGKMNKLPKQTTDKELKTKLLPPPYFLKYFIDK